MIVAVRAQVTLPWHRWVLVPDGYKEDCRQVAFRKVFRRKENSQQELLDHTWPIEKIERVSDDGARLLMLLSGYGQ